MDLVITNGTVLEIDSGRAIPDAVVLTGAGRIISVGTRSSAHIPPGAEVVDADGGWIIPGLINLHVHFTLDAGRSPVESMESESHLFTAMRSTRHARQSLESGVTTARDLGSRGGMAIELRDAVAARQVAGPRIIASGLVLTMTGGHGWYFGREVDGPEEVRKAVRAQSSSGADVIKLMASGGAARSGERAQAPGLTVAEMRAAVEEAHRAGLTVAAHALTDEAALDAVEGGVDSIEHGAVLSDQTIDMMVQSETALVSTLSVHQRLLSAAPGDPFLDAHKKRAEGLSESRRDSLLRAISAGVKIGAGSDAGTVLNPHGDFVGELEEMVKVGISPLDALRAATVSAATILRESDVGELREGNRADILVIADNPSAEISTLRNPLVVVKGGELMVDSRRNDGPSLPGVMGSLA